MSILPSLIVQSLIPYFTTSDLSFILLFLPLLFFSLILETLKENLKIFPILLSLYGALSVLFIFLNRFNNSENNFSFGSIELGFLFLWIIGISFIFLSKISKGLLNFPRTIITIKIMSLATILTLALSSIYFLNQTQSDINTMLNGRFLYLLIPILSCLIFFITIRTFKESIHPFIILSILICYTLSKEFIFIPRFALFSTLLIPMLGLTFHKRIVFLSKELMLWGLCIGAMVSILLSSREFGNDPYQLSLLASFSFGFLTHFSKGKDRSLVHLVGSLGSFLFIKDFIFQIGLLTPISHPLVLTFEILMIFYFFVGVVFEKLYGDAKDDSLFMPMDDISLLAAVLCLAGYSFSVSQTSLSILISLIIFGIFLILRSFRDRTVIFSFFAINLFASVGFRFLLQYFSDSTIAASAFFSSIIAFILTCLAIFFPVTKTSLIQSRKVFLVLRLPFPGEGLSVLRYALISTACFYIVYAFYNIFIWYPLDLQPERIWVIQACLILASIFLISFLSNFYSLFNLRGSAFSLSMVFICVGLGAIANRIGRPLPPHIVGINLTSGILVLWIVSRIFNFFSYKVSIWLENPTQGKYYHHVPLTSMLLLGLVLIADVFLLGQNSLSRFLYITPPTFFLGSSIAFFLYSRSINFPKLLHVSFGLLVFCFVLIFTESSFLGTELVSLSSEMRLLVPKETFAMLNFQNWFIPEFFLPNYLSPTILILKSTTGIAVSCLFFSLFCIIFSFPFLRTYFSRVFFGEDDSLELIFIYSIWTLITSSLLVFISFQFAFIEAGFILLLAGFLLRISPFTKQFGSIVIGISGLLIIEGYAHAESPYPFWVGPVLSLIGISMILSIRVLKIITKQPFIRLLKGMTAGMFLYSLIGILYALATDSASQKDNAWFGLIRGTFNGASGAWLESFALPITLTIFSISVLLLSFEWRKKIATIYTILFSFLFTFALLSAFPLSLQTFWLTEILNYREIFPKQYLAFFGFISALMASLSYLASRGILNLREEQKIGFSISSEGLILVTAFFTGIFLKLPDAVKLPHSNHAGILSIALVILICSHVSIVKSTSRHLYFLQVSLLSFYSSLKPLFPNLITPQIDSIFALIFGFILVGVSHYSQRKNIPQVSESTRRFAAFMPILASIILPTESSYQNAGMAVFSSFLYASLGFTSSNKIYTVLSAISANLAVFTLVDASNVQGFEIYLAPIGVFTILLGHIYRENLNDKTKQTIRIAGGLLLYLPAAFKICFEIGRASDPFYALIFGILCICGILLGMLFEIRSYVYFGTIFFTLNLIVNILQSGFRDQRLGFIYLSLSGLFIIFALIFFTLKRDLILGFVFKLRAKLNKWED